MTLHTLKVAPPYFDALLDGKTFDVRRNDRGFQKGDTLRLWEYKDRNSHLDCPDSRCTDKPREVTKIIAYVYAGDPRLGGGVEPGFVVLGLGDVGGASA